MLIRKVTINRMKNFLVPNCYRLLKSDTNFCIMNRINVIAINGTRISDSTTRLPKSTLLKGGLNKAMDISNAC